MHCIDVRLALALAFALALARRVSGLAVLVLVACAAPPLVPVPASPLAPLAPLAPRAPLAPAHAVPAAPATPTSARLPGNAAPAGAAAAPAAAAPVQAREPRYVQLAAPATPRSAQELRQQFAKRLVAAHPDTSYSSRAPDRLLAIPVLEIALNADGSVRKIDVLRKPSTGDEATVLAIAAIRRAAPYGDVSRLPKPWKVIETFLFDDDLRFKPRTLDTD